jgi:hypothetical protein
LPQLAPETPVPNGAENMPTLGVENPPEPKEETTTDVTLKTRQKIPYRPLDR